MPERLEPDLADPPEDPIYTVDVDDLPPIKHRWIDRGEKLSCEGAGHPNHQAWKFKPKR
jgi:hypothetical protein